MKLDYLNLDLDNIPGEIIDHEPLNFNVSRLNNDKDHRIFRFVPIDKIDILITPCLRTDPLKDKYSKALPLHKYILPADDEVEVVNEMYEGVIEVWEENHKNGVEKLGKVMTQAVMTPVDRCWLNRDTDWIGNSQKKGVCHFLVNDQRLKGWVKKDDE